MDNIIDLAEYLFMRGCTQKEIALKVGRSESTVAEWVKKYGWKEKRAGTRISRNEMVSKLLNRIDDLLSAPEGGMTRRNCFASPKPSKLWIRNSA